MMMTGSLDETLLHIDMTAKRKPNIVVLLSGKITMSNQRYVNGRVIPEGFQPLIREDSPVVRPTHM